jgi:hypothetical protein
MTTTEGVANLDATATARRRPANQLATEKDEETTLNISREGVAHG